MNRTLLLVLLAGLFLGGCAREVDPLDWKIAAGDAEELQQWLGANLPLMPNKLGGEVVVSINNIKAGTPLGPTGNARQKSERLARRLDGHTVREVLVEGYELVSLTLLARINNESEAVVRLLGTADALPPDQLKKLEAQMNAHLAARDALQQQSKEVEGRLAELRALKPAS